MTSYPIKSPRKLIEVALPLDAINVACAKEKSIRQGHPCSLHLWWARRPLAAARAVIFAQLVNDPGYQQGGGFKYGKNKKEAAIERKRLFKIIGDLVLWENTTNQEVLESARQEIRRSWREVCELNKDHPQAAELFNPDMIVSKAADYNSTLCGWISGGETLRSTFGRQAIPMVWDYCEANILGSATGSLFSVIKQLTSSLELVPGFAGGLASQGDAQSISFGMRIVSTDPPYYDNIAYADLSDFFYVWLRRSLKPILPSLFYTIAVPKAEELIAAPYRHGGQEQSETFFLDGMSKAMHQVSQQAHQAFPVTIYYAFKQSESDDSEGTFSTGWEVFLDAVIRAGFALTGTWPLRTERGARTIGIGTNSLASSIVLVCRKRPEDAPTVSRREFQRELNNVLPEALDEMTKGAGGEHSPVAPVDLSQAIIGPGMGVFSKYSAVLEADGSPMSVRTALQLINRFLAEDDFDHDTQFCLHWFEQHGWNESVFGEADTLARAKGTSVDGVKEAGVLQSGGGKVRLLKWSEYPTDWDPSTDKRTPIWEALHQLIRAFRQGGDSESGALLAALGGKAEAVRQLAYRLYTLCERLGHAEDARAYNELITSWTGIESAAAAAPKPTAQELPGFER